MATFLQLRLLGDHAFDLDGFPSEDEDFEVAYSLHEAEGQDSEVFLILDEGISDAETIPGSPDCSEAETIPVIEIIASDLEVEIVQISRLSQLLTIQQEHERMRAEERYGHFHRVELHQAGVQERLSRVLQVLQDIANEAPEHRRARRLSFRRAVHGNVVFE